MVVLLVGWVGKCCSELGTCVRRKLDQAKLNCNTLVVCKAYYPLVKHFKTNINGTFYRCYSLSTLTCKELSSLEYLIDIIFKIESQQIYLAHYQPKNSELTVQPLIRTQYNKV